MFFSGSHDRTKTKGLLILDIYIPQVYFIDQTQGDTILLLCQFKKGLAWGSM